MTTSNNVQRVELRCPTPAKRLLGAMRVAGQTVKVNDGIMELACKDCKLNVENIAGKRPKQVVHLYSVIGECVGSEVIW